MKTAIIGLGSIGLTVAKNLVNRGAPVILAERNSEKAKALAQLLGDKASALPIDEAIATADIVILAVWLDVVKQLLVDHRAALSGKIIVDPSNPIAPDGKGGFVKTIPAEQSSGGMIAAMLPSDTRLVKAFGSLAAGSLAKEANRNPERAVLFYASDHQEAAREVAKLIEVSGFDPINVGGIDQSIRIEVFGDLHEFGKLGRAVSRSEAEVALAS